MLLSDHWSPGTRLGLPLRMTAPARCGHRRAGYPQGYKRRDHCTRRPDPDCPSEILTTGEGPARLVEHDRSGPGSRSRHSVAEWGGHAMLRTIGPTQVTESFV